MTTMDSKLYLGLTYMGGDAKLKTQSENGNIVCYSFNGCQLTREYSAETYGAVLDLCALHTQKVLVAGINSKVVLFDDELTNINQNES